MSGFLYYVPGVQVVTADIAARAGLGYVLERDITSVHVNRGPDGRDGAVCAIDGSQAIGRVRYVVDEQAWRRVPGSEAWVGLWTTERPGPADLARASQLGGHWVEMGDGQRWLAPVARQVIGSETGEISGVRCALPQRLELSESGQWEFGPVVEQYRGLWEIACQWFEVLLGAADGAMTMDFDDCCDEAVRALAVNYRLGRVEAALLGLLTVESVRSVLGALVDLPTIEGWRAGEKKTSGG